MNLASYYMVFLLAFSISCSHKKIGQGRHISSEKLTNADKRLSNLKQFKDIFYTFLKSDPEVNERYNNLTREKTKDLANKFVYIPQKELLDAPKGISFGDHKTFFEKMEKVHRQYSPYEVYKNTVADFNPKGIDSDLEEDLLELLEKHEITLIVLPGIFGEFIDVFPYENAFKRYHKDSNLYKDWIDGLTRTSKSDRMVNVQSVLNTNVIDSGRLRIIQKNPGLMTSEEKESFRELRRPGQKGNVAPQVGLTQMDIKDLIRVTSIPNPKNPKKPIMNIVTMLYKRLTMESLTDPAVTAQIYNDRLDKVFQILGKVPKNLFVLGYSRGAATILEMVLDAKNRNKAWYPNFRGTVSLGGTNYGTEIADMLICAKEGEVTGLVIPGEAAPQCSQSKAGQYLLDNLRQLKSNQDINIPGLNLLPSFLRNNLKSSLKKVSSPQFPQNLGHWAWFGLQMLETQASTAFSPEFLKEKKRLTKSLRKFYSLTMSGKFRNLGIMQQSVVMAHFLVDFLKVYTLIFPDPSGSNEFLRQMYDSFENGELFKVVSQGVQVGLHQTQSAMNLFHSLASMHLGLPLAIVTELAFGHLALQNPLSDYDNNLYKFLTIVNYILDAGSDISTPERIDWFSSKDKTLPSKGIRYYSISGVMGNPRDELYKSEKDFKNWKFERSQWDQEVYDPRTFDFGFLHQTYNDLTKASGISLNDSQVNLVKSIYWEELNEILNEGYKKNPIQVTPLAVLGTHHWGFAFPVAATNYWENVSPFPRLTLLKSMAAKFALDLESGEISPK